MALSSFERLPAELRNQIQELALYRALPIVIRRVYYQDQAGNIEFALKSPQARSGLTALTRTCKMFRSDCSALFYSINRFTVVRRAEFDWAEKMSALYKFLMQIGERNRNALRSITLDLGTHEELPAALKDVAFEFIALCELEPQISTMMCRVCLKTSYGHHRFELLLPGRTMKTAVKARLQDCWTRLGFGGERWWWDREQDFYAQVKDAYDIWWPLEESDVVSTGE
ncbi:hypothetical protein LTR56_012507 [Elasticomyces elasticus]|nr:hypothetical protein LTR56_012507 [Elasticomyces elasticus]KAK3666230.1 hypothetical protein LTR22_002894 [Elasticomyces elasticus]KAK4926827.1 hypothetical protein LTR49_006243 [Elasticomyces elasticus]KAK5763662.1 hypothetical protein LTS12_006219 [Elasticomyces elasticus]